MFSYAVTDAAIAHAVAEFPKEAVGAVVAGAYVPLENVAADPTQTFAVAAALDVTYGDALQGLIHSHCGAVGDIAYPVPSAIDMTQQQAMALPWGIVAVNPDKGGAPAATPVVWFGDQAPRQPMASRGFIHGHQDCWTAIREWHAARGVNMADPPRDWEWWLQDQSLYLDLFKDYGFEEVEGPVFGAMFLVAVGRKRVTELDDRGRLRTKAMVPNEIPNHAGIYLGNHKIFHHISRKAPIDPTALSCEQPLGLWGPYFNVPPIWVRHRDLP